MGILDSAGSAINRGISGTQRAAKTLSLKNQITDLEKQRTKLTGQLGVSLFEDTRNDPILRSPRETLYASIEDIDVKRDELQAEVTRLENEAIAAANLGHGLTCPVCGLPVGPDDAFCMGCGTSMSAIKTQLHLCQTCGTQLDPDDAFCMACGTPVEPPIAVEMSAADEVPLVSVAPINLRCDSCGHTNLPGAKFCKRCGNRLG